MRHLFQNWLKILKIHKLIISLSVNTHVHADHVTGTGELKKVFPKMKSVIAERAQAKADMLVGHGDQIKFGKYTNKFKVYD